MPARATGRRGDVLPGRVAGAAVHEQEVLALEPLGQRGQPRRGSSSPIVACVHSIAWRASTLNASMSSAPTAAASWLPRTPTRADLAQARHDRVGLRAVAHDVAQLPDLVDRRNQRQHRIEGRDVGMDVRQDGDAHRGSVAQGDRAGGPDAPLTTAAGGARPGRAGSAARSARRARRRRAGGTRGPARRGSTTSTRPARSARSAGPAAASSSSSGRRFQATRIPPGADERQADLDQLRQRGDGARGHRGPRLAIARVVGQRLGADGLRGHRARQPRRLDHRPQEADLLGDRVDEQHAIGGQRGGEGQAREPAAAAEVEQRR